MAGRIDCVKDILVFPYNLFDRSVLLLSYAIKSIDNIL